MTAGAGVVIRDRRLRCCWAPEGARRSSDLRTDTDVTFLGRTEVLDALHEAAERSVRHPGFVRRRDWTLAVNAFAMVFAMAGDHVAARPLFRVLGKRATLTPWVYLDARSPMVPFLEWRSRVGV